MWTHPKWSEKKVTNAPIVIPNIKKFRTMRPGKPQSSARSESHQNVDFLWTRTAFFLHAGSVDRLQIFSLFWWSPVRMWVWKSNLILLIVVILFWQVFLCHFPNRCSVCWRRFSIDSHKTLRLGDYSPVQFSCKDTRVLALCNSIFQTGFRKFENRFFFELVKCL